MFTSGTLVVFELLIVFVVVVKLMHVFMDGIIGITGITTTRKKSRFKVLSGNKFLIAVLTSYSRMRLSYWSPCFFADVKLWKPIGDGILQCDARMIDILRETCWRFLATNAFFVFGFQFDIRRNGS